MKQIFYNRLQVAGMALYIGISERGLAFVGSDGADIDELEKWGERVRADLIVDEVRVKPYAEGIAAYLMGARRDFDLSLDIAGTPFQEAVWQALVAIPYGETRTYSEIASEIGKPQAVRAVGTAIGANPVLMVVPCHRVIGKNGKITGYRGGVAMKERLLRLEA
ncbi:methylated-DNA--[protein]-cysteine S-methyltransferase [Listeria cornellensis]|uniref:methylated-DNA--[protein]-cysteine S-methyltransferase n=1 Tax=Listeria cornellensis FSL F6-0969 TaxID=1265820 RepID=W7CIT1_9LIST|nr:methylated-DNA--[protein]-cysteine S-methyltransferase [Listeria cornellensis]EUJ32878.1 methylated DNA-protein cysteine methyltransferase [Listeria cornellensis FSL F6-0969]